MKKNVKRVILAFAVSLLLLVAFSSCDSGEKNARVQVWLTDAPGDYQEVNVDIQGVDIHSDANAADGGPGWKALTVNKGVYNLLELTNGLDTLLGEIEIPGGRISQIRLKLGNQNSIKVNNQTFNLTTPSGQQSGLKLQVHEVLAEGITYKILLDFDVARSIVLTGSSVYKLKPVIRAITQAQDGAIKGVVVPAESTPAIYAIQNLDTLGTTYVDSTGHFLLRGLAAGSYSVVFAPNSNYSVTVKDGVTVQLGVVTDMGNVAINP
ncbi:MAG: DUF4382 domain-containing protein [Bacteroidota bacterium]